MSLVTEYRDRHNLKFVFSVDEGVTFFDDGKKPAAIVTTSSHSRSVTNCRKCLDHKGGLIGELFVHTGLSHPNPVFRLVRHEHVEADVDLRGWANDHAFAGKVKLEPFVARDDRQVDCWLWRFFVLKNAEYARKGRWMYKEDDDMRALEQISTCIDNSGRFSSNPRLFEAFYKYAYSTFLIGRKYTIYGSSEPKAPAS